MSETVQHSSKVKAICKSSTVKEAATAMLTHKVGCLIVNDDDGRFAGIITERDIVSRTVASSKNLNETAVAEVMTEQVLSCPPGTATNKLRELMAAHHIRHLPIVDNGVVVGVVSARDLMEQQLFENRAAAEEVAMLSNCLKSIDLNEVANIVTREAPKLFQAERCVLYLQEEGSGTKNPTLVSYNKCLCLQEHLKDLEDAGKKSGQSNFCHDDVPEICRMLGAEPPRLVIPLQIAGPKQSPSDKSIQLYGYACMCGLAASTAANKELITYKAKLTREILNSHLTNAKLYQQARLTSLTDPLTGVGSRKLLEDKLEVECTRAKRYRRPFSVAIVDLDNFKTINDVLGHATGDSALKRLTRCMKSQKRAPDILARYGGDEFVILMPETRAEDAVSLLERLRTKLQQISLGENLPFTVSCGIAESSLERADSASEVMRRADIALYEAKSAGRNCVRIWDQTMAERLKAGDIEMEKVKMLQRRIAGLSEKAEKMFIQSIWGLVQALEAKDSYAKQHSENVMHYAMAIAETMQISPKQMEVIRRAAMIHDIGKIGIPDAILSKPGKLTPRERSVVEQHPLIAVRILEKMTFLQREIAIVRHHHEKWNGQGYPDGLSKTSIPLGARILAVADTFDAVTSARSYRNSRSVEEALEILVDASGYDFDPDVVRSMISWVQQICQQKSKRLDQLVPASLLDSQKDVVLTP
jgi:diguanylate cyclase (GGDEF)-like protein/putative nucleotidyltransferase with HDIG domain